MRDTTVPLVESTHRFDARADAFFLEVWDGAWAHPWLGVLLIFLVARASVRVVRDALHGMHARDAVRTFSRTDKVTILARAGWRCERHHLLGGGCRQRGS